MQVLNALLDSWDRQCRIVEAVATLIDDENRRCLPSPDGWPLDKQLAHIHKTRTFFLSKVAPQLSVGLGNSYSDEIGTPIEDLHLIKRNLAESGIAIRNAVASALQDGCAPMVSDTVTYDNPILLLQHMVWHEGWHVGLIFLALRLNGQEPSEEWDEENVWGLWRTESW